MGTEIFWIFLIFIALQPLSKQKATEFVRKRLPLKMEQKRASRWLSLVF